MSDFDQLPIQSFAVIPAGLMNSDHLCIPAKGLWGLLSVFQNSNGVVECSWEFLLFRAGMTEEDAIFYLRELQCHGWLSVPNGFPHCFSCILYYQPRMPYEKGAGK